MRNTVNSDPVDRIRLMEAVGNPILATWRTDPYRIVDVRMSYLSLKIITDLIIKMLEEKQFEIIRRRPSVSWWENIIERKGE